MKIKENYGLTTLEKDVFPFTTRTQKTLKVIL